MYNTFHDTYSYEMTFVMIQITFVSEEVTFFFEALNLEYRKSIRSVREKLTWRTRPTRYAYAHTCDDNPKLTHTRRLQMGNGQHLFSSNPICLTNDVRIIKKNLYIKPETKQWKLCSLYGIC